MFKDSSFIYYAIAVALCVILYLRFKKQRLGEIDYLLEQIKVSIILFIILCFYCYVKFPQATIVSFDYPNGLEDVQGDKLLTLLQHNNSAMVQLTDTLHLFFLFFIMLFMMNYLNLIKVIKKLNKE